jgi:hypothetical protein
MASNIPIAAIKLPCRAVAGDPSRFKPKINKEAATK